MVTNNLDISISNLHVSFDTLDGEVSAVRDITTSFEHGKITGMIGESGSGKSIIAMSILQLLSSYASVTGKCTYKNDNLLTLNESEIKQVRGKEIGLIPQNPNSSLNPMMKLKPQLIEPLLIHKLADKKQAVDMAQKLLKDFNFEDEKRILNSYTFQLSGGMNQRVISAQGLICNPPWIIADEPTKGLDSIMRKQVYKVLKQIYTEHNCGIMVITHDLIFAKKLCHNLCVTFSGEIVEQGSTNEIFETPLHPYTAALLNALPEYGMNPIHSNINLDTKSQSSCQFFHHCPKASENCVDRAMEYFTVGNNRKVRCFLYA